MQYTCRWLQVNIHTGNNTIFFVYIHVHVHLFSHQNYHTRNSKPKYHSLRVPVGSITQGEKCRTQWQDRCGGVHRYLDYLILRPAAGTARRSHSHGYRPETYSLQRSSSRFYTNITHILHSLHGRNHFILYMVFFFIWTSHIHTLR